MKFNIPCNYYKTHQNFISSKIQFCTNLKNDYQSVNCISRIPKNEVILIEYPCVNLYEEKDVDRGLQIIKKYFILAEQNNINIAALYPRVKDIYTFPRTPLIKQIHKIIKNISDNQKLYSFFSKYTKTELEFYYAKYIFNAFEGLTYGPLTLHYLSKFNHSCNNNIAFTFDINTGAMVVRTIKVIEPNEELFISYLLNKTIPNHKQYLLEHYGFIAECNCK
jgi:hypothetical protein